MSRQKIDKKRPIKELSHMCKKHFGEDYEHWSWEIDTNWETGETNYGVAIELPKNTPDGTLVYTDPFIFYSKGTTKGLIECANEALSFMYSKFEDINYDYSNPFKPEYTPW
jgi:hypothetical protein